MREPGANDELLSLIIVSAPQQQKILHTQATSTILHEKT